MGNSSLFVRTSPFPATPDPRRYVAVGSIEQARQRLMRAIDRDEGPAVLVGPSGTGKTLLCQVLAAAYRNSMDVALLSEIKLCTRRALLQMILFQLGMPYREREEGELRLSLLDRLRPGASEGAKDGLLLIVDEAQSLPPRLIDELRMISGVVRDGKPRVRLILAGNMRFEERLSEPSMEPLAQRVSARCYLHPLHLDETCEYIREHLRRVGLDPNLLLDESGLHAIHQATLGIPRVINQLLDQTVLTAEARKAKRLELPVIEAAWAEMNQLPAPLSDLELSALDTPSTSVVEFGALDDDDLSPAPQKPVGAAPRAVEPKPPIAPKSIIETPATVNKPERDPQPAIVGNHLALAFSTLEESASPKILPVDAICVLTQGDGGPWSFTQAPVLDPSRLGDRWMPGVSDSQLGMAQIPLVPFSAPAAVDPVATQRKEVVSGLRIQASTTSAEPPVATPFVPRPPRSDQAASAVFGADFDEVIELKQPTKVSARGPLPWEGDVAGSATWLESFDHDDLRDGEFDLHRQVISISSEARQSVQSTEDIAASSQWIPAPASEELSFADDRDLLVVADEVDQDRPALKTVAPAAPPSELEYRDLFSRLRQG